MKTMPLPSAAVLAALFALCPAISGAGTIRIDFGRNNGVDGNPTASPDANGNYWNNVTGDFDVAPGNLAGNLVTADNTPTAIGIKAHPGWRANGINTGGLLAPDPLLLGDAAIATATQDYFFVEGGGQAVKGKATLTITGLDPSRLYTFRFFATRAADDVRTTTYRITAGSGIGTADLQTTGAGIGNNGIYNGNDDEFAEIPGVQADSSGQAILDVSVAAGSFAYLGVMEIVEGDEAPPITSESDSGRVLIDFGRTDGANGSITVSPDTNGNWWNNFIANGALPNLLKIENLFTSDHKPTNISITTGAGGGGAWESNGVQNGGLLAPSPALLGDFAIDTVTQDYFFIAATGAQATMEISGLNPAKTYTFRMFGTRQEVANRVTTYTVYAGNGVQSTTLQTSGPGIGDGGYNGNNNNVAELTNIQSTTSTTVKLELTATTGGFAYIGALEILETGDAPVIPAPVSATGIVRIDFGRSDGTNGNITSGPDANGNWWNNFIGHGGVPAGRALYNLVTTDNVPTTIDVTASSGGWDSNGRNNGGLLSPSAALLGDFGIATATEDYIFRSGSTGATSSITISGLDPGKRYDFRMFGTRQETQVRETTYTITGSNGSQSADLQTSGAGIGDGGYNGNNNNVAEIGGVTPDPSGTVLLDVTIKSGGFAYLGILDIIEVRENPFMITGIVVTQPDTVSITFNSTAGKLYGIDASTTLAGFTPIGEIVATGPTTVFTRTGVNLLDREFFRVADLGDAPPLLSEDFENGNGGFTTEDKSAGGTGSDWQFGTPDSVGFDNNSVQSGNGGSANCWGTDISNPGYVTSGTDTCLRSPVIDLTNLTSATLNFAEALDIEENDLAEVYVVEADTGDVVAGPIHTSSDATTSSAHWAEVGPIPLPAEAFGRQVRLEWRFTKVDAGTDYLGWYIDDVIVNY